MSMRHGKRYEGGHRGVPGAGGFGRGAAGGEVEVAEKASKGGWAVGMIDVAAAGLLGGVVATKAAATTAAARVACGGGGGGGPRA